MSSHTFQFATENVWSYACRAFLGPAQALTLQMFCFAMMIITREVVHRNELPDMDRIVDHAVSLMIRDFPLGLQVNTHFFL